jgi:hypothetical protein
MVSQGSKSELLLIARLLEALIRQLQNLPGSANTIIEEAWQKYSSGANKRKS